MNTYQKRIIDSCVVSIDVDDAQVKFSENMLIIEQSENAYIEKYNVTMQSPAISNIEIDKTKVDNKNNTYHLVFDFTKKSKSIYIEFIDNIADPLSLEISYLSKSKEEWDEKNKLNRWKELESKAQIKVSTGIDLVNIYFQPCSEDYSKTVIELYTAIGKWSEPPREIGKWSGTTIATPKWSEPHRVIGRDMTFVPSLLSAKIDNLMGKFIVEDGMFFKSITGLALGVYGFKLSQFSTNGDLLFTSDYQFFAIQKK